MAENNLILNCEYPILLQLNIYNTISCSYINIANANRSKLYVKIR